MTNAAQTNVLDTTTPIATARILFIVLSPSGWILARGRLRKGEVVEIKSLSSLDYSRVNYRVRARTQPFRPS